MEVVEAAGQLGSYSGVFQVHMEVLEAAGQPGSYPGVVQFQIKVVEAAGQPATLAWCRSTWRLQKLWASQAATLV